MSLLVQPGGVGRVSAVVDGEPALGTLVAGVLALALGACVVAAVVAFAFRWYGGEFAPDGVPILVGLSVIAIGLNTTQILQDTLEDGGVVATDTALVTVATFVVGTIAADAGRRVGEHVGADLPSVQSVRTMDADVGQLVRAGGRTIRVSIPETIDDVDGYEPVPHDVKTDIAGATFRFPRRLTVEALRARFVDRLTRDYDVGHVDVEFDADGTIQYLAVGRRVAGIGQTLGPGTVAVAVRADPALSATAGDRVQLWRTDGSDGPVRIASGELRAAVDDVATVVVDETVADALADDVHFRLVTTPEVPTPDREFATLLRTAEETTGTVTVQQGSDLVGAPATSVGLTVAVVERGEDLLAIPSDELSIEPGDRLHVIGRLDEIRRLELHATAFEVGDVPASDASAEH